MNYYDFFAEESKKQMKKTQSPTYTIVAETYASLASNFEIKNSPQLDKINDKINIHKLVYSLIYTGMLGKNYAFYLNVDSSSPPQMAYNPYLITNYNIEMISFNLIKNNAIHPSRYFFSNVIDARIINSMLGACVRYDALAQEFSFVSQVNRFLGIKTQLKAGLGNIAPAKSENYWAAIQRFNPLKIFSNSKTITVLDKDDEPFLLELNGNALKLASDDLLNRVLMLTKVPFNLLSRESESQNKTDAEDTGLEERIFNLQKTVIRDFLDWLQISLFASIDKGYSLEPIFKIAPKEQKEMAKLHIENLARLELMLKSAFERNDEIAINLYRNEMNKIISGGNYGK